MVRRPRRRTVLAVLCTVLFVTFLDNTIVSVTLADIQSSTHAGVQTLQWVVNGYALAFASLMLGGGMLGDLFGRKKVMLSGLGLFAAGSVIAAVAPNDTWLLAGRVVMGVGAAGSEPGTLSVIRHVYDDRAARARALGIWAAVSGCALALGPVIAGLLVGLSGWRLVFWFNLVLGAVAFAAAVVFVPESADPEGTHVDVWGIGLGAVALASGIFAVIEGEQQGYTTGWIIALFVLSAAAGVAFVVVELRRRRPVLDLRLLRRGPFAVSNLVAFTTYFGTFSIFFFVALYLQLLADQSPYLTALDFVPMAIVMVGASALTGRWVARQGPRVPMVVGCALGGCGILAVDAALGPDAGFLLLAGPLALAGAGFGIALVPVTSAALDAVPGDRSGMAASATNTSRELGAVFGVAVLGAVLNAQLDADLTRRLDALGIPADFQSIVIEAVTHGGVPQNAQQAARANPAAANAGPVVEKVISAAERSFASGLHVALLISAVLLLASGAVAWFAFRWAESAAEAGTTGERVWDRPRRPVALLRPIVAVAVVVGAAFAVASFTGAATTSAASGPTSTTTTPPAAGGGGGGGGGPGPSISLQPATGLHDGQTVQVTGSGFAPGEDLVVVECAAGPSTGPADCALGHSTSATSDARGDVTASLTVVRGPFGAAGRTCGNGQACQVAVSVPSASAGGERATAAVSLVAG